jgi:uncharacterized protein YbjT (DUF2867 family)
MKVLVAGGTGFIGRHICKRLLGDGHAVKVLGRNPAKISRMPQLVGAEAVYGDVTDPATLA